MDDFVYRITRLGSLVAASMKAFFDMKTSTRISRFDPERTTLRAHLMEVARQDFILLFEPFTKAVAAFKREAANL
jgi:hypothetical protein